MRPGEPLRRECHLGIKTGQAFSEVVAKEGTGIEERAPSRLQLSVPERPGMDHGRPNLESCGYFGGRRRRRKAGSSRSVSADPTWMSVGGSPPSAA